MFAFFSFFKTTISAKEKSIFSEFSIKKNWSSWKRGCEILYDAFICCVVSFDGPFRSTHSLNLLPGASVDIVAILFIKINNIVCVV